MVSNPSLLMLDEPLANLDLRSQGEIVALVDRLRRERGVTVLFVTHGVNPIVEVMDRVWYVAGGHAEIGPVGQVIRPEVLGRLYGSPVDVVTVGGRIFVSAAEECHGSQHLP
jgi:zinc/manganese transport system ATP-binding protein